MKRQYGSLSRSITALSLAIGLSFGGAATIGVQADDDNLDAETAFLYQGNTSNFDAATMVTQIDDLDDDDDDADDIYENDDDRDDDDADDIYENDDDRDDDDADDLYENDDDRDDDDADDLYENDDDRDDDDADDIYENDDDWDDDDADDVYESDDDWDDDDADDVYESDDDWDDDDADDVYESDDDWDDDDDGDDDGDDFLGKPLNLQTLGQDDWEVLGNGEERPAGLISSEDELEDDLNLTVQTLADGDYMIVVHANGSIDSPVLAAGNIEGDIVDGSILIELDEVEASGFEGRGHLEPEDDDDINEIEITVGVYPTGSVQSLAEPIPTPRG